MKITDIITRDKPSLSFEVFPPKEDSDFAVVENSALSIARLMPDFMSVTYGAGGGTSKYTAKICSEIKDVGVTPLAHLTCISSDRAQIRERLSKLKELGIENILALRGDIPKGGDLSHGGCFKYASEFVREISDYGGFTIGGACYPEGHPESENYAKDIEALKIKVECGVSFLTTQMFFDNDILYNFLYRLLKVGVDVPVVAGIMPVTNAKMIKRIISISQNALPQRFLRIVDRYADSPEAMTQAGIAFATEQIIDLYANGINAVHVYSMNKPHVAKRIKENLSEILK